jgi:hypothetical protein
MVHFEASHWKPVVEQERRARLLLAASRMGDAAYEDSLGAPRGDGCGLVVQELDSIDLDGDGRNEKIVRFDWLVGFDRNANKPSCDEWLADDTWNASTTVLMRRRDDGELDALGVLAGYWIDGQTWCVPSLTHLVKTTSGELGLRVECELYYEDSGETPDETWVLRNGSLVQVGRQSR